MIESGPIPAVHGVVRWRLIDLAQWIFEEFRITIAKQTLSRELRAMGYRKLSARPRHHAQAEGVIEDFKKASPARLDAIAREKAIDVETIEIWFAGRGSHRPEEQDHPPLGEARHTPERAPRSAHRLDLHLRRRLPQAGQGRGPDPARLQHRGDEPAPRGDRPDRRARRPRRPLGRSGWLAHVDAPRRAAKHHHHRLAAEIPRAQPGGKRLAVHARQLALQPRLQILRRSRRPLLRGMEQARRSALAHHVHRIAPMGARVLINETWRSRFYGDRQAIRDLRVNLTKKIQKLDDRGVCNICPPIRTQPPGPRKAMLYPTDIGMGRRYRMPGIICKTGLSRSRFI